MKQDDKQQTFLHNASHILDQSVEAIDETTSSRLRQIRYQALANKAEKFNWFTPLTAVSATTAVLVLSVSVWLAQPPNINDDVLEDISLLTSADDLEFYQQLEFYSWLDDEQING